MVVYLSLLYLLVVALYVYTRCYIRASTVTIDFQMMLKILKSVCSFHSLLSINFVKNDDIRILRDIEQYYSTQIDEMPMNGKKKILCLYSAIVMIVTPLSQVLTQY